MYDQIHLNQYNQDSMALEPLGLRFMKPQVLKFTAKKKKSKTKKKQVFLLPSSSLPVVVFLESDSNNMAATVALSSGPVAN